MQNLIHVAAGIIEDQDENVLVALRAKDTHQGGLWEFPGGKCEAGETAYQALIRELDEELAIQVHSAHPLITIKHDYGDRAVLLDVWKVINYSGQPVGRENQAIKWVSKNALYDLAMPAADLPIVRAINLPAHYAITPPSINDTNTSVEAQHLQVVDTLLARNIKMFQLRDKTLSALDYRQLAQQIMTRLKSSSTCVLLNCDLQTAIELQAEGVHLSSAHARAVAQQNRIVPQSMLAGVSCHNESDLQLAESIKADFAVLGPVNPTLSHPQSQTIGWAGFANMVGSCNLPVYALGGMMAEDLPIAYAHGAQGIAAIRGFLNLSN